MEEKEFVYELTFPDKTGEEREFVEHLWARRKVGYLLDQIRANGEKQELVHEVVTLAKKYGITTPYTSYLVVPDGPIPVVRDSLHKNPALPTVGFNGGGTGWGGAMRGGIPAGLAPMAPGSKPLPVVEFARQNQAKPGELAENRGKRADKELRSAGDGKGEKLKVLDDALEKKATYDRARRLLREKEMTAVQAGKLGVDLSVQTQNLRNQARLEQTAVRNVFGRNCLEIGGVWIDEGFDPKLTSLIVKAQSDAYFKLLELQPKLREVFRLGNHLVWVTPNGTALVIDTSTGKVKLNEDEIAKLFVAKK
jgi:Ca-activated chloride channel family protein